jgi:hypothetical protein
MPAEGGVIGRDFRKRDEEKFARHLGLLPSSSGAALVRSTPGSAGRRGGRRTFVLAGGCRINNRRCWMHTTSRSAPRELWRSSSHIRGSIAKVRPPATGRASVSVVRSLRTRATACSVMHPEWTRARPSGASRGAGHPCASIRHRLLCHCAPRDEVSWRVQCATPSRSDRGRSGRGRNDIGVTSSAVAERIRPPGYRVLIAGRV